MKQTKRLSDNSGVQLWAPHVLPRPFLLCRETEQSSCDATPPRNVSISGFFSGLHDPACVNAQCACGSRNQQQAEPAGCENRAFGPYTVGFAFWQSRYRPAKCQDRHNYEFEQFKYHVVPSHHQGKGLHTEWTEPALNPGERRALYLQWRLCPAILWRHQRNCFVPVGRVRCRELAPDSGVDGLGN